MDAMLWVAALVMLLLVVNLAVLAIAQRRAATRMRAELRAGCTCGGWHDGIHWPGCPVSLGLVPDPRTLDDVLRGDR